MVDSYATTVHPLLPLSITVRNVFPPLALTDNNSASQSKQGKPDNLVIKVGASASEEEEENPYGGNGRSNDDVQLQQGQSRGSSTSNISTTQSTSMIQRKIKLLSTKISSSSVEERCALVSKEVLLRLRLDIIITKKHNIVLPSSNADADAANDVLEDENKIEEEEEILIYSSAQSSSTLHPLWDHVDEHLESILNHYDLMKIENDDATNTTTSTADAYARFVILPSDHQNGGNNNNSSLSTTTEQPQESTAKANKFNEWILAEIPLHPSKLRRLPTTQQFTSSSDDEAVQSNDTQSNINNNNNGNSNASNSSMIIPSTLPPNTILLHYNDGYTRVLPSTYWILVQKGFINESVVDPIIKRHGSGGSGYTKSHDDKDKMDGGGGGGGGDTVFEDKTFNLLGKESVKDEGRRRDDDHQKDTSPDNVYHDSHKVFDLLGDTATTDNSMTTSCDTVHQSKEVPAQPSLPSTTNEQELVFHTSDLLLVNKSSQEDVSSNVVPEEEGGGTNEITDSSCMGNDDEQATALNSEVVINDDEQILHDSISPELPHLPAASIIQAEDCKTTRTTRDDEIDELKRLVQLEQHLLEEEQSRIDQVKLCVCCVICA